MSEHLIVNPTQLYLIYTTRDIHNEYYDYDFLPEYSSFDVYSIYDAMNSLSINSMNNLLIYIFRQWSLLNLDPELHTLPKAKRRKDILSRQFDRIPLTTKDELNTKLKKFIGDDKILGLYLINQIIKFLYPCKL